MNAEKETNKRRLPKNTDTLENLERDAYVNSTEEVNLRKKFAKVYTDSLEHEYEKQMDLVW